jgi:1-acyl-sn-glycerol-3-phosphate acyltransferase
VAPPLTSGPVHRPVRVRLVHWFCAAAVRLILGVRVEGRERFATGPAIYCFNHLNWVDPVVLLAVLPERPKYAMLGPKEADMTVGGRNRLIMWAGFGIPYRPEKSDLLATTRRVTRVLHDGWVIAIAGEGRIHRGERELLPLADGPAWFALRAGVPIIPIAVNGTSWLGWRRRVRVRVGPPLLVEDRPTRAAVAALTGATTDALLAMTADFPDPDPPGRFGRWLTELFNDWPEGARPEPGEGDGAAAGRERERARAARDEPEGGAG